MTGADGRGTIEYRLGALERDIRGVASSVTNLTQAIDTALTQVKLLEDWKNDQRVDAAERNARQEERDKTLTKSLEGLSASIASLKGELKAREGTWGARAWGLVQPVLIIIITFAIAGGFQNIKF